MSESKLKATCAHEDIALDATVNRLTGTDVLMVAVAAECKHCKRRFNFVGDYGDTPSLEQPSITGDRRMVLLPMVAEQNAPLIVPRTN